MVAEEDREWSDPPHPPADPPHFMTSGRDIDVAALIDTTGSEMFLFIGGLFLDDVEVLKDVRSRD